MPFCVLQQGLLGYLDWQAPESESGRLGGEPVPSHGINPMANLRA